MKNYVVGVFNPIVQHSALLLCNLGRDGTNTGLIFYVAITKTKGQFELFSLLLLVQIGQSDWAMATVSNGVPLVLFLYSNHSDCQVA